MDDRQREAALRTVPAILESQAFLSADPLPAGRFKAAGGEAYLAASLVFEGHARGGVMAAFPEPLARELAANQLGSEPDGQDAAEHAADALGEFLNAACGNLLTAVYGTGPEFNLSAPRSFGFPAAVADLLSRKAGVLAFEVEGAPILFQACFCGSADQAEERGHG